MVAAIETQGLTRDFSTVRALDHLDLTVDEGEIFGFLGPNGAGKSTAIRLLLDFIRPTAGRASVLGHDCQADSIAVRREAGFLPGDVRLYPGLTGHETVALFATLRGMSAAASGAADIAERLELQLDRIAGAYSKGNRQKLGLVLALMGNPRLLILDEPSSGLDPLVQHQLWSLLRERAAAGTTVFFSSHVMSEVEQVCERVGILRAGRLVAVEDVSSMKVAALRHLAVRFAGVAPPAETFRMEGVRELRREDAELEFEVQGDLDAFIKQLARHHVLDISSEQPTLEELLMTFYEREGAR